MSKNYYFTLAKSFGMCNNWYNAFRGVAQFGRAPRSGRGGRKFKSCHLDHSCVEQCFSAATFLRNAQVKLNHRGVAQVVAHQTGGLGAASSSLVTPTIDSSYLKGFELFLFILKNGLNRAFSDFLRIFKSLSRILKMHRKMHQN